MLAEAFRVLKPGGRFAVSDVVVRGRRCARRGSERAWSCGLGASPAPWKKASIAAKLATAGFENVDVEPTRIYRAADARSFLIGAGLDESLLGGIDGKFMSAFVRARKPDSGRLLWTNVLFVGRVGAWSGRTGGSGRAKPHPPTSPD